MKKSIQQKIDDYEYYDLPDLLPMFHSTDFFCAEQIINHGKICPTLCTVFKNEKLTYLFYGKPSYDINVKGEVNRIDNFYYPVCYIIDPKTIELSRVYPFDSGAFMSDRYRQFFHKKMSIDEFEITPELENIQKYISIFFGDNDNYNCGHATLTTSNNDNSYVEALCNLFNTKGALDIDERAYTVEVLTTKEIILENSLKALVLPEDLLRKKKIIESLSLLDVDIITYKTRAFTSPTKYYGLVYDKIMNYIYKEEL